MSTHKNGSAEYRPKSRRNRSSDSENGLYRVKRPRTQLLPYDDDSDSDVDDNVNDYVESINSDSDHNIDVYDNVNDYVESNNSESEELNNISSDHGSNGNLETNDTKYKCTDTENIIDLMTTTENINSDSDECSICLCTFVDQQIGIPNKCEHKFCAICIKKWSKNKQICPIDRRNFTSIIIKKNYKTSEVKEIHMSNDICEICLNSDAECYGNDDDEDDADSEIMLFCNHCLKGFHKHCLIPPPLEVTSNDTWFCQKCQLNY